MAYFQRFRDMHIGERDLFQFSSGNTADCPKAVLFIGF